MLIKSDGRLAGVTDADGVFDAPLGVSLPLTVSYIYCGDVAVNDTSCGEVKVSDKKGKEDTYRLTPEGLFRSRDVLAGKKDHKMSPNFLKLIGATIDFTRMDIVSLYVDGEDGVYRPWNLAAETMVVEVLARGKLYKMVYGGDGDISTRMVVELHPREVQYVTVEESKALAKRKRWEE